MGYDESGSGELGYGESDSGESNYWLSHIMAVVSQVTGQYMSRCMHIAILAYR